jgi:DNA topoisomerase VI subunit A
MEQNECQKQMIREAFYGGRNTIVKGLQDRKEGRDRMVQDLEKQLQNE